MQPHDYTIKDLFNGEKVFLVPRYQRPYVWNEQDQWAPLWDDVIHIANRLFDDVRETGAEEIDDSKAEWHFIGTLVLKPRQATLRSAASKWLVIDGQQRLTTLQLMLSAVADEFDDRGIDDSWVRNLISNQTSSDKLKIEHRKFNQVNPYDGFSDVMTSGTDKVAIETPMSECYKYFRHSIAAWFDTDSDSDVVNVRAEALGHAIIYKFRLVAIELGPKEEEHKIFETLNARGAPLTEWDKIKNLFLAKVDKSLDDETQDNFYEQYLNRFDSDWWRGSVGSGAQHRPRSDWFADYWVESRTAEPVGVRRVFREFQQYVENSGIEIHTIADEMVFDSEYYEKYEQIHWDDMSVERRFHNRRLRIGLGAVWPALWTLNRRMIDFGNNRHIREQCVGILDSYFMRRKIVGYQSRSYPELSFALMQALNATPDQQSLVSVLKSSLSSNAYEWPSDSQVRSAVNRGGQAQYLCWLLLEAIERHITPDGASGVVLAKDLEVEHIMPRAWDSTDYPIAPGDEASERRQKLIESLGNKTLITGGWNRAMSNAGWQRKLRKIRKDNLYINKDLADGAPATWDEEQIEKRGEWMADKICEIWQRPESA